MIRKLVFTTMLAASLASPQLSMAATQPFPSKPVTVIVPWPAGGGTDILARALGQKLGSIWNQPVVVENRSGAVGFIGAQALARAAPDGYTIMMTSMALATNKIFLNRDQLDPTKDFAPVTLLAGAPHVLVVRPDLPVHNIKELLALAKPGTSTLKYSSAGPGSPWHLAAELFKVQTGADMLHVPYKGGAPAVMDLLGKQVDLTFANIMLVKPYIEDGSLRVLGVTTRERSSVLPDVPTLAEQGVKDYDFTSWYAFYAPKGTDEAVLNKLSNDIRQALSSPEVKRTYVESGLEIIGSSPGELAEYMKKEIDKWTRVAKAAHIAPE
ncbi:Bug family tripartite tricarboxylate transporter substrate binding protein [Allopusillimonas ginsengisoli]|uniref:Bug family tripartite tricarboxylate transporter substrate binding protein n=1 Tax=Allopusillimonas ginsengisoli TaxID=453575 RepID=UPI00101FE780|nr:tripartite tricarboxylate transporter substrate binding protein [Allopusillimonas ginsengisoli]TEA76935.1 tripartite tricarboxylate transporter substrate binding protein [Allopusillimonas ginsengisoli]